jgi:AcrR family transcriptional regulator
MATEPSSHKTRWQEKREASYAALIDAAMHCFHERGYAATRVEDIAEAAGYTTGAFYFHFKNKAECFEHVIAYRERLRGDWQTLIDGLDPATTSLEEVLARLFARFAEAERGAGAWILVMVDYHQQHRDKPNAQALLHDSYRRWHGQIADFLGILQERGWIPEGRDPSRLAADVFAYSEGTSAHAALYGADRGALVDTVARLLRG